MKIIQIELPNEVPDRYMHEIFDIVSMVVQDHVPISMIEDTVVRVGGLFTSL